MCTYATEHVVVRGSGKAAGVWAPLARASVYVDHPYEAPIEHTLTSTSLAIPQDGLVRSRWNCRWSQQRRCLMPSLGPSSSARRTNR